MAKEEQKLSKKGRRITVTKDGPYIVSGGLPLTIQSIQCDDEGNPVKWVQCKRYPSQENYSLCRCGRSSAKPYCDGTHARVGFDGTETASREPYLNRAEKIEGPGLDLTDAKDLCAVARFCHKGGGTWNLTANSDDPQARDLAIDEAGKCPSGRLVAWDKETGKRIEPDFEQTVAVVEDPQKRVSGPIWVRGGVPVQSAEGATYEVRNRATLCRCGKSQNKPFCDGNHIAIGFKDGNEMILEQILKEGQEPE